MTPEPAAPAFRFPTDALLAHWQGHRRVTRRVIDAFPDADLFAFSLGGMRPFASMALEMIAMARAGVRGLATGDWTPVAGMLHHAGGRTPQTKADLLALWDETTVDIDAAWPAIPPARFEATDTVFGAYEGVLYVMFLYWVDNEIHHRGQGYVYLRALGIEPPPFYERG